MLVSDRQAQWGEKKRKEKKKVTGQGWVGGWEINKPLQDSRTRKVGRRGQETNTQERQHDYRLEKYTSLCRRLLSSEHCDTGVCVGVGVCVWGGGSYPGFGMMSPRDQSLASSDWPCLSELEGSQGEDGGGVGGWRGAVRRRQRCLWLWVEKGRGRKPSHAAALCFPPQHLHITPQWWQARRGR